MSQMSIPTASAAVCASASVRRSLRSETTDWLSPFRRSLRPWRRPPPRPGNPALSMPSTWSEHFRPLSLRQRSFRRPEGSVVCSPCCIFHNGHGCQFFRRPWLFLFPASVAWDAVSRQSVYAGTTAAGVDRTSIGRGPTHTTYPLGDILQPESGENFPPCGSPAPLQW